MAGSVGMVEIVNLRDVRKQRAKQQAADRAAANRIKFGRGKQERLAATAGEQQMCRRHEAHRRDDASAPVSDDQ